MMVEQLAGTQIYLKPSLSQALSNIAQQEAKTVVYLVEELLEKAIRRKQQAQEPKKIRLAALERIKQHRAEILVERKGNPLQINLAAILEGVREERDDELFANYINRSD